MQHRWTMYANLGDRRIPQRIDNGLINLPAANPDSPDYQRRYDPENLFVYLQNESDLSFPGLYLSIVGAEFPTLDGKRWFFRVPSGNPSGAGLDTVIRWVEKKDLRFWDSSFRTYTNLYQGRGIMDYSTYISRCFGYVFLVGQTFVDDEDDGFREFVNFYPSLHHYHQNVMFDETELWRPPSNDYSWESYYYGQDSDDMDDENQSMSQQDLFNVLEGIEQRVSFDEAAQAVTNFADTFNELQDSDEQDMAELYDDDELDDEELED